jgi:transposase
MLRIFLTEPATGCGGKVPRNSKSKKHTKELLGIPFYSPWQNPSRTAKKIFFTTFSAVKHLFYLEI